MSTDRDARIVKAYLTGRSLLSVAKEFDLTGERIRQILKLRHIPLRRYSNPVCPNCGHVLKKAV